MTPANAGEPQPVETVDRLLVRPKPPTGRCHECGSPKVRGWCCNCHRVMCTEHDTRRDPAGLAAQLGDLWPARRRRSVDSAVGARRHYCQRCARQVNAFALEIVAGAAALVVGTLVLLWNVVLGTMLIVAGVAVIVVMVVRYVVRRKSMRTRSSDALSIDPTITSISIVDTVRGIAELRDERYEVRDIAVSGQLSIEAEWSDSSWSRVHDYRRRHADAAVEDIRFSAGALVLRGPVGLALRTGSGCRLVRRCLLLLGDRVGNHPLLSSPDGRGHRSWRISADYDITKDPDKDWVMPIWLTPALVPGSDRRSLELEFQWAKFGPGKHGLSLASIDRFWIAVPMTWGSVLAASEEALVSIATSGAGAEERLIEWRNVQDVDHVARGRHSFALTFENQIPSQDSLRGHVEAGFRGNLCRIEGVDLFGSDGGARSERLSRKLRTVVCLDFTLSLASVRYQAVRVLPQPPGRDQQGAPSGVGETRRADPTSPEIFDRVAPDGRTVARVTAELGAADYYVKRVVENPPKPGRKASVVNRYWDIAGRKYEGVYPIDFHLTLTGHEVHDGGTVVTGQTHVVLSVRGAYATPEMDLKVHDEWQSLGKCVAMALSACRIDMSRHAGSGATEAYVRSLTETGELSSGAADDLLARVRSEFGSDEGV